MIYRVPPQFSGTESGTLLNCPMNEETREMDKLAVKLARAKRSHRTIHEVNDDGKRKIVVFVAGDSVLIAKGKAIGSKLTKAF